MLPNREKRQRLLTAARLYYEQNLTQDQIAAHFGISRPMVSKLLAQARQCGIVHITVQDVGVAEDALALRLMEAFSLRDAVIAPTGEDEERTDRAVVQAVFDWLRQRLAKPLRLGLGWGSMVGKTVDFIAKRPEELVWRGGVCPLLGGAAASSRNYHVNELTRALAEKTHLSPLYLYAPALVETAEQRDLYMRSDEYRTIAAAWDTLDLALLNISNYPSSPDMATAARFGGRLAKEGAVGHIASYYFRRDGALIQSETDYALRISPAALRAAPARLAICSAAVKTAALLGALRSGFVTHAALSETAALAALRAIGRT